MLSYDFFEIDLLWEILNFKIVSIEKIKENIVEKNNLFSENKQNRKIDYIYGKLNYILVLYNIPVILRDEKNFYFTYKNTLKLGDIFIYRNSMREEMIELILFLSNKKLNVRKFLKRIDKGEENRRHIKNDLKRVLKKYGIDYVEYKNKMYVKEFLKSKIENYETKKINFLLNIFITKWEKIYYDRGIIQEKVLFDIIKEYLDIKNLDAIYEELLIFLKKYKNINSKRLEYKFLLLIIMNLKNEKINVNKLIDKKTLELTNESNYKIMNEMLENISKIEGVRIHEYFKIKLYKYLLKKSKKNEKYNKIYSIEKSEYKVGEYIETYVENSKDKKLKTLIIVDLENKEFVMEIKYLQPIINKIEIYKIINMYEYYSFEHNFEYEQILVISNINIKNILKNNTNIPVYYLYIDDNIKGNAVKKRKMLRECNFIYEMMVEYNNKIEKIKKI